MNNKNIKWILFVEDPGALNFFLPIIYELDKNFIKYKLIAEGTSVKKLSEKKLQFESFKSFCKKDNIREDDLLIIGTSENKNSLGFKLIDLAKEKKIKTIGIVDSPFNASLRFKGNSKNLKRYSPEYILLPDKYTLNTFLKLGYKKEKLFVVGNPIFDDYRFKEHKNNFNKLDLPKESNGKIIVVFISELSTGLNPKNFLKNSQYTLSGRGKSIMRTEIVAEEFIDCIEYLKTKADNDFFTILRKHPKETKSDLEIISKEFNYISEYEDPIDLVFSADLVVGMSSILLNQSYLVGTESIALLPEVNDDVLLPSVRNGDIKIINTRNKFKKYMQNFIEKFKRKSYPQKKEANKEYKNINYKKTIIEILLEIYSK